MASIKVCILGEPVAQARHRTSFRHGKRRQYDPTAQAKKEMLKQAQSQHPHHKPFSTPLSASIIFSMARPSSHFRSNGQIKNRFKDAVPIKRPDLDNLVKGILDAMNGFIYLDDKQIVTITASKIYGLRAYTQARFREV